MTALVNKEYKVSLLVLISPLQTLKLIVLQGIFSLVAVEQLVDGVKPHPDVVYVASVNTLEEKIFGKAFFAKSNH